MLYIVYTSLLLSAISVFAAAKPSINVLHYEDAAYPYVKANFFAFDKNKKIITNLSTADFSIVDNGSSVAVNNVECRSSTVFDNISITISFDLGMNSKSNDTLPTHFSLGQLLAVHLIREFDFSKSECAFSSFDFISYMNNEFTSDTTELLKTVSWLIPQKGSNYNAGFLSEPVGALYIANKAKYSKNIIFITDGASSVSKNDVINYAKTNNIAIYCVSFSSKMTDDLKEIAIQSGGFWFENVKSVTEIESISLLIKTLCTGYKPCTIDWTGERNCDDNHIITISIPKDTISTNINLDIESSSKPYLESNPPYLGFSSVLPGLNKELPLALTARNGDITINDLSINSPYFVISEGDITSSKVLRSGETHNLKITFSPVDSAIVFTKLKIESNACIGNEVFITGGFPNTPPKTRTLNLLNPNFNEILFVGDTTQVSWIGLLPADVVQLEYTIDGGTKWDTLALDVTGLDYTWPVPDRPSKKCLARVIQLWPNNIGQTLDFRHSAGVNCAWFNKDGNMIITASKDTTASVWNSNTGKKISTFSGHTQPINTVAFHPNEQWAVSASEDSTAKLWNVQTGELIREYIGHRNSVMSAYFNADGSKIVTASKDGMVLIWNTETGKITDTIVNSGIPFWHAVFNSLGDYVLTSNVLGKAQMWNTSTKAIYKTFNHGGVVVYSSFSPDESKIATASWNGDAKVWDVASGDTLFSVIHPKPDTVSAKPINSVNFNSKGDRIITAGFDQTAVMWNATTGAKIAILKEHTSAVTNAVFNFDGTRVLTSSWDSLAKVWNLDKREMQMDSSDGFFRIAKADIAVNETYFGQLPVNESIDTTINTYIKNKCDFHYKIESIEIEGEHASDFTIVEGYAPYTIDSLAEKSIEIRFSPSDVGIRNATMKIKIPGATISKRLYGEGYNPGLTVIQPYIDFQKVEIGDFKDTVISTVVKNKTNQNITCNEVQLMGPDDNHFDIIEGGHTFMLQPGETHQLKIRFTPEIIGRCNGVVAFHHNGIGSPSKVSLFGEGVYPLVDTATIAIGNGEGKAGDIISIPIYLKNVAKGVISPSITGFNVKISFNSSMLEPTIQTETSYIVNGKRTISLNLPAQTGTDSILSKVTFKVALGNDTLTNLTLSDAVPLGSGKIVINEQSGVFKLTGLCDKGGKRLFDGDGKIYMDQNKPNPFVCMTIVEYELIEPGQTTLYIIDMSGRKIKTYFDNIMLKGKYSYSMDASELPPGKYFYILQTPSHKISKLMEIMK